MSYNLPPIRTDGDGYTYGNWNADLRDNFAAVVPDVMTTKGDIVAGTGTDAMSRLGVGADATVLAALASAGTGLSWKTVTQAAVYAKSTTVYTSSGPQLAPATEVFDNAGAYSGGTFTAPLSGYYLFSGSWSPGSYDGVHTADFATNEQVMLFIKINGAHYSYVWAVYGQNQTAYDFTTAAKSLWMSSGLDIVYLAAGDALTFWLYENTGRGWNKGGDADRCWFTVSFIAWA